jgi:antitoxin component of MazEF toxin-antitoxin module
MHILHAMQIQRKGQDLVIVLPPEVAQEHQLHEGDEVLVLKTADRKSFEETLEQVLHDYAGTFEYLKDK